MLYQRNPSSPPQMKIVTVGIVDKDPDFRKEIEKFLSENENFHVIFQQDSLPVHYEDLPCKLPNILVLNLEYFRWVVQLYADPTLNSNTLPMILFFSENGPEDFPRASIFPCVCRCTKNRSYAQYIYFHIMRMVQLEMENGYYQQTFQYYILNDSFDLPTHYLYAKEYLRRVFIQSAYSEHGQGICYLSNLIILASSRLETGINMTELYAEVGEQHNVSGASVEKCIRNATEYAWSRYLADPSLYSKSPIFCQFHRKPKNMELVYRGAMLMKNLLIR